MIIHVVSGTQQRVDQKIDDIEARIAEEHQVEPYEEISPCPELGDVEEVMSIPHATVIPNRCRTVGLYK